MIIDNIKITVKDVLKEWIEKSDEVMICSPFISHNDVLFELIEHKFKMTLICRLSYPASPDLFTKLFRSLNNNQTIYVYDDSSLHSKIYYFKKDGKGLVAIIGSSNFTDSGIYSNKEYNIVTTEELERIETYFVDLKKDSYGKLNYKIIDYYKTFYRIPLKEERYKNAKISNKLSEDYNETLKKFYRVKGILERENNTELPFTYVFDSFCHFFKTKIKSAYLIEEPEIFDKDLLKKYFKLFKEVYYQKDKEWRTERYILSKNIVENLHEIPNSEIKKFYLGIHSITSGSGSGVRKQSINEINNSLLRELLEFLLESNLSMPHKFSIALTKREKNGLKIPFLGNSGIGEIPGWLIPDKYPIKNEKLHYILNFFKI
ncbi:MAG: NgoFVII family restriction endonuclease [Bacteroidales bacterium]|nr:NgoFVII family restriction endonuclease [Bacteroidales bacterium]